MMSVCGLRRVMPCLQPTLPTLKLSPAPTIAPPQMLSQEAIVRAMLQQEIKAVQLEEQQVRSSDSNLARLPDQKRVRETEPPYHTCCHVMLAKVSFLGA